MADAAFIEGLCDRQAALKRAEDDVADISEAVKRASKEAERALKSKDIELYKLWHDQREQENKRLKEANERLKEARVGLDKANERLKEANERLKEAVALEREQIARPPSYRPRTEVELTSIPSTTVLNDPDKYEKECVSLTEWGVDAVHKIPIIWTFMKSLGGCSNNGRIFWRIEDKQVMSLLLDGWFQASSVNSNKKSILMGSPGIGKSTMLCLLAFYAVFKHKKNVLVYRRLAKAEQEDCLFYLGYEEGKVVQFAVHRCKVPTAIDIYEELIRQQGISNVWLMLDGFQYKQIPQGIRTFKLLATSQQVDLKSQERTDAYCCLFSCWRKQDLFKLGEKVAMFSEDDMEDRFYYSGGSVREFTLSSVPKIKEAINFALRGVADADAARLLSTAFHITSDDSQVDRLRRTFVNDATDVTHLTDPLYWQQMVDSEYAVRMLSLKLPLNAIDLIYRWARTSGHRSLAGCAFEIYIHRLAAQNQLKLKMSEYDPPAFRKPHDDRHVDFKQVALRVGGAVQWGTSDDYTGYMEQWRDNDAFTYWFPACDNFPNIDSIVKLESTTTGKKPKVAYLQVTIAKKHGISSDHLKTMNSIFCSDDGNDEPPIFIAICPDEASCTSFVLESRPEVLKSRKQCQVFVGYPVEIGLAIAADGPKNDISVKPVAPDHSHRTRSTCKRSRNS